MGLESRLVACGRPEVGSGHRYENREDRDPAVIEEPGAAISETMEPNEIAQSLRAEMDQDGGDDPGEGEANGGEARHCADTYTLAPSCIKGEHWGRAAMSAIRDARPDPARLHRRPTASKRRC